MLLAAAGVVLSSAPSRAGSQLAVPATRLEGLTLPAGSSLTVQYGAGDPFRHEVGGGLSWSATGVIDTRTQLLPVALEGRLFVPRGFESLMPMRLIVVGHGNLGSVNDVGWYVSQLEKNGPVSDSVFVAPALTHGTTWSLPDGPPGASEANAWRMLVAIVAAITIPGLVDGYRVCGFGYSVGAASNIAMMSVAGTWPELSRLRGGASMAVGVFDGLPSWPQSWQVAQIRAPQVVINGALDQYINHWQAAALVDTLTYRNVNPSVLVEYPGVDHFALPSLSTAWSNAAHGLAFLTR